MSVAHEPTANELFKVRSARNAWRGILAAVALHVLVFALAPSMTITNLGASAIEVDIIAAVDEIPPPPPEPDPIQEPGPPVFGDFDPELTIRPNTDLYDARSPLADLPPVDRAEAAQIDAFMPRDVNPVLKNGRDVTRLLERTYPALLRDAGIGGTVVVWFFIDETGTVQETRLNASSGHHALDRAALAVAAKMEFGPAMLRGRPVPVWVSIPIVFTAR